MKCFKLRENFYETKDIIKQAKDLGIHANANNSATEAIAQLAIQDPNGIIVVCGSFYSAGKIMLIPNKVLEQLKLLQPMILTIMKWEKEMVLK